MDNSSLIKSPISEELDDFKKLFDNSLTSSNFLLNEVISHIRQKNGKMMRPILLLLVAKLYGRICPESLHAAVSLELLHTASLVHDDVAIIDVVSRLGQNLSEGELLQLSNVSNLQFSEEIYFDVIRKKTAVLFAACTKSGALSVGVTDEQAEFARQFGEYIGLCFQIKDDIFDYYDSKEIGKPTGNDMLEGKLTLPVLYALNSTKDESAEEIAVKVKNGTASADEIARLIEFAKQQGGIEYAVQTMFAYKEKALSLLASLPDSDVKAGLAAYLDYVVDRDK